MSDSFADLWNSSAPSKPTPAPRLGQAPSLGNQSPSLGSLSSSANGRPPPRDIFSALAASGTPPGPSRTITPATSSRPGSAAPSRPAGGVALPGMGSGRGGGDAFSGLGSFGAGGGNTGNMTMAERAAHAQKERATAAARAEEERKAQASAWAGLDSLGQAPASAAQSPAAAGDDWLFELGGAAPATKAKAPAPTTKPAAAHEDDDWGLGGAFSSSTSQPASKPAPKSTPAPSKSQSQSLWDLDAFASPSSESPLPAARQPSPRANTPGEDFDFGNREDRLMDDHSGDEDDILGALSKPVDTAPKRAPSAQPPRASPSPQPPARAPPRTASPPPHIIGQIVEMGFSPQQARVALAATDTGLDVQAALETLLSNGAAGGEEGGESSPPPRARPQERFADEEDDTPAPRRRPQPGPRRTSGRTDPRPAREPEHDERAAGEQDWGEHADKLLAQASEIGASMFARAGAFWSQSKEKVQRAVEERQRAMAAAAAEGTPDAARGPGARREPTRDGRPKWMQEAEAERDEGDWGLDPAARAKVEARERAQQGRQQRAPEPREPERERASAQARPEVRTADLFSDEAPAAYVSPFRRRPAASGQASSPAPAASPAAASPAPTAARRKAAPSPPQLVYRQCVSASASAIAASAQHKAGGTEKYKLGQYADAEALYTRALDALPEKHLLRVPLLTNRAAARLKTGDHAGAAEDCTAAINIIGPSYHPAREAKVEQADEGAGVDLADGLVKALRRRAEAGEGREKWASAREDWEALAGKDWAPQRARSEAVAGVGRCRKMEGGGGRAAAAPAAPAAAAARNVDPDLPQVKPRPKGRAAPKPFKPVVQQSGEALARVQAATAAAEAEDDARHALKDSVDARLLAWKGGKEANLRALIASLDTVLWDGAGVQKVGMHELVTPNQVKVKYTRAIARLHPDKLNASNTTLEQRMIANGVFGALNEAWTSFKQ